jgi:hypothetical protein
LSTKRKARNQLRLLRTDRKGLRRQKMPEISPRHGASLAISMVILHVIAISWPGRSKMYDRWNQVHITATCIILKIQEKSFLKRLMIGVTINGIPIDMEVDTGAKGSLIGRNIFEKYFSDQSLHPTGCLVRGSPLPMMGEFTATVCYRNQQAQ